MEMKFYGDYHTHSNFSDAVGNPIKANIEQAIRAGLTELAFTEHGFANYFLGLTDRKVRREKRALDKLRPKYPQLTILQGIEADIISFDGTIDLPPSDFSRFDVIIMGFHRFTRSTSHREWRDFTYTNGWKYNGKPYPQELIDKNTAAMISAISRYPVDILAHLNHRMKVDVVKVGEACTQFGTLVELNLKHLEAMEAVIEDILPTGCNFVVSSDAHRGKDVGAFDAMTDFIERHNVPLERIANLNGRPDFRSKRKGSSL